MTNKEKGNLFEEKVQLILEKELSIELQRAFKVDIGFSEKKKHEFDLGNDKIIVECKDYSWTKGNNIPSAKISHLREVMFYFSVSPLEYKKLLVLNKSIKKSNGESLGEYFIKLNKAFIPNNVEIYEIDGSKLIQIF